MRYIMARRRFQPSYDDGRHSTYASLAERVLAEGQFAVLTGPSPRPRRVLAVFDGDPDVIAELTSDLPEDMRLEQEILHWPDFIVPPTEFALARQSRGSFRFSGAGSTLDVWVTGGGAPLANAHVRLYVRRLGGLHNELQTQTDSMGHCQFIVPSDVSAASAVVSPAGQFWTMVAHGPELNHVIECPPLPLDGPVSWWHRALGINQFQPDYGRSITVGIVDSGAGPHPNLAHIVYGGAFIDGNHLAGAAAHDIDSHGTHVAGIVGAQPSGSGHFAGISPGCNLVVARVFPDPAKGANQADIANAIDALSIFHDADLINLSLGSTTPSDTLQDAIVDAEQRGTLCVCAAGNDAGPVNFPAAFPEAVAVSALGLSGFAPSGSLSSSRRPDPPHRYGVDNLFLANFSSSGPEVACAGPGVGIISTVPDRLAGGASYGAMDGTSMACPAICASLASLLGRDTYYSALPRDKSRTERARDVLKAHLRDVELDSFFQGGGIPIVSTFVL